MKGYEFLAMAGVVLVINLGLFALCIWIAAKVLQGMGVL